MKQFCEKFCSPAVAVIIQGTQAQASLRKAYILQYASLPVLVVFDWQQRKHPV